MEGLRKLNVGTALADLPVRVLLETLGRSGPDAAGIVKELERILGGTPGSPGRDLDFGGSPP